MPLLLLHRLEPLQSHLKALIKLRWMQVFRSLLEMQVSLFSHHLFPVSHSALAGVQIQGPLHI